MEKKRYFPNLNGIRCIAAMLVVFHHLEQAKHALGIANIYELPIIQHAGRLGVGLFFVLSGFLITYLLLEERGRFGDVDAKKFYLRRVFRIWPIYFLIIGLSFFVFPHIELLNFPGTDEKLTVHAAERLTLLLLVLPNFAFVLYDLPYWCAQTWSIGVEEQFYYLWPWLIKYPKRRIPIILLFLGITAAILFIGLHYVNVDEETKSTMISTFLGQFRIQTMALGGLCAWLVYNQKSQILQVVFRKDLQIVVYTLLLALFLSGIHFYGFLEVYALFFAFFILNVSCNPNTIISLNNAVMSHLGKVSYGLYIYHVFVIVLIINILTKYLPDWTGTSYHISLYVITFVASVAVASFSYSYFEKPLLAYKDKRFGR
ncbi:acyltransferase family protein [Dyadobacter psychrophilus]|uniref:Peptidoglycan/LPS O-acetylase OafA/YrhL, contains acyltransferase and SGNH-hydrolase domains n=1 Tax=Dyadobacter psychrophilus TaxID=651661 RepID=A0A1T5GP48_9BACT|nr:acyltransferase [Dyadobacter psychrophilus]SKC10100.1 Peptidoglycan/LPS O-acetylase OafA/YrhL, contains acyltransferase and SGNH-hydrolase domains [Dyadobacter psychrophilus]